MKDGALSRLPLPPERDKYTGSTLEARASEEDETVLAGTRQYQKALAHAFKQTTPDRLIWAVLRPEPENKVDPNAIAVYADWKHVGYLKAQDAIDTRDLHILQRLRKLQLVVPMEIFEFREGGLGAKLHWSTMDTPMLTEAEIQKEKKGESARKGCGCLPIIILIVLVLLGVGMCVE
jgi:hypothetical protein